MRTLFKFSDNMSNTGLNTMNGMKSILAIICAVLLIFLISSPSIAKKDDRAHRGQSYMNIEEDADMVLANDEVITGDVEKYSKRTITLDGAGYYSLCRGLKVYDKSGHFRSFEDLETAEEVKIFLSGNCVRKIKILRVAQ